MDLKKLGMVMEYVEKEYTSLTTIINDNDKAILVFNNKKIIHYHMINY